MGYDMLTFIIQIFKKLITYTLSYFFKCESSKLLKQLILKENDRKLILNLKNLKLPMDVRRKQTISPTHILPWIGLWPKSEKRYQSSQTLPSSVAILSLLKTLLKFSPGTDMLPALSLTYQEKENITGLSCSIYLFVPEGAWGREEKTVSVYGSIQEECRAKGAFSNLCTENETSWVGYPNILFLYIHRIDFRNHLFCPKYYFRAGLQTLLFSAPFESFEQKAHNNTSRATHLDNSILLGMRWLSG